MTLADVDPALWAKVQAVASWSAGAQVQDRYGVRWLTLAGGPGDSVEFTAFGGGGGGGISEDDLNAAIAVAEAAIRAGAPSNLDTLGEQATAIGGDPNFAGTVATALAGKASTGAVAALSSALGTLSAALAALAASGVSVDPSGLSVIDAANVQAALAELDAAAAAGAPDATLRSALQGGPDKWLLAKGSATDFDFQFVGSGRSAAGRNSAGFTLGPFGAQNVPFDVESHDAGGYHNSINNDRFTVPSDGYHLILASVGIGVSDAEAVQVGIKLGTSDYFTWSIDGPFLSPMWVPLMTVHDASPGDFYALNVACESATHSVPILPGSHMSVVKIEIGPND